MQKKSGKSHKGPRKANKVGRSARTPGSMGGMRVFDKHLNVWVAASPGKRVN